MKEYTGKIYNIEKLTHDTTKVVIESALDSAHSGQFISVLCENRTLRRPFSISDFEKIENNKSLLTILVKIKGKGTEFLSNLKINDEISILAPLGNGFNIKNEASLLVGAGIGIAPMLFLKKELNKQNINNYLIAGFRDDKEIIKGYDEVTIGGSVVDRLEDLIKEKNIKIVYACGPEIVLKLIGKLCKKLNIKSQLAMEKVMACGIGVCRGCVIKIKKNETISTASICKDGPVFSGDEIIWEENE